MVALRYRTSDWRAYSDHRLALESQTERANTPNRTEEWVSLDEKIQNCLRLIKVSDYRADTFLRIVMSDEKSRAVAYLDQGEEDE